LDLNDPDIKEELLRIQKQHLQEIRNWSKKHTLNNISNVLKVGGVDPNGNVTQYKPSQTIYEKKTKKVQETKSTNNNILNNHSPNSEETMEDSITNQRTEQEE